MNPRERVMATLEGRPVDRPPIDIWYTDEVLASLLSENGEDLTRMASPRAQKGRQSPHIQPGIGGMQQEEMALWRLLGLDKIAWVRPVYRGATRPVPEGLDSATVWGCLKRRIQLAGSEYVEYAVHPLAGMEEVKELEDYPWWPDPEAFDFSPFFEQLDLYGDEFATIGPPWISAIEVFFGMRGIEEAMVDLLVNPEFARAVLDRIESIQTRVIERALTEGDRRPLPAYNP